jgi:hypothetical protein
MLRTALCVLCGLLLALAASPPAAAAGCEGDGDCKAGRVCLAGRCAARPTTCSKDSECPGDLVCEQTRCVLPPGEAGAAAPAQSKGSQQRSAAPQVMDLELPPLVAGPGALTPPPAPASGQGLRPVYARDSWPLSLVDRPVALGKGMAEGTLLLDKSLSDGSYDQLGVALSAHYGVDERLTAGVEGFAICLTGCGGRAFFESISFDARYLYYSDAGINVAPEASLDFQSISSPFVAALGLGVQIAYKLGPKMTLWVEPRLGFGVVGRDSMGSADSLRVRLEPRYALTEQLTLVPIVELYAPLGGSRSWALPFGAGAHYGMTRQLDLGGDFTLGTQMPYGGLGFFERRTLRLYLTARL